jgi:hypothetical protein
MQPRQKQTRQRRKNKTRKQNPLIDNRYLGDQVDSIVAPSVKPMMNKMLAEQIVHKRMTFQSTLTAAAGTGVINPSAVSSSSVASLPANEWTSYQARFQLFRVRKLRYTAFPVSSNTSIFVGANISSYFAIAEYANIIPSTAAGIISEESCTLHPTAGFAPIVREVDWSKNTNAKLWTETTAGAIVADRSYGLVSCSAPNIVITQPATATLIFALVIEWEVEFKNMR